MNILIASLNPIFKDKVLGGAQKQLRRIALYLAEHGHQVTILCTRRPDSMESFSWHENLQVIPIFNTPKTLFAASGTITNLCTFWQQMSME